MVIRQIKKQPGNYSDFLYKEHGKGKHEYMECGGKILEWKQRTSHNLVWHRQKLPNQHGLF